MQIGANDGVLDDPLRELITTHHLRGLLIEPLPDLFATLAENYKGETQLSFEQVAIARRRAPADLPSQEWIAGARLEAWPGQLR